MPLALLLHLFAHVPTYDGAVENCFSLTRPHTISQAIYLKGSGGTRSATHHVSH
jgi:hypothetical protein